MKEKIGKIKSFFAEVRGEAGRVTWPGKRELYDSTLVVIAFIFILAVAVFSCDTGIRTLLGALFPSANG